MKTIQQCFAEMSALGLVPKWYEVYYEMGTKNDLNILLHNGEHGRMMISKHGIEIPEYQPDDNCLRNMAEDLVKLEWQKPTEDNVGEMCWFYVNGVMLLDTLNGIYQNGYEHELYGKFYVTPYCLLATHGRLCPEIEDFEEVKNV